MIGLLFLLAAQGDSGFTLERNARVWAVDSLGRLRQYHRKERVRYQAGNLLIEDLTFGDKLLIRTDRKTVWKIDTLAGTYSELTFDQIRERQKEVLQEIRDARDRVKGSNDEAELTALLETYGWFDADPAVKVTSTGKSETIAGRECVGKELMIGKYLLFSKALVDPSLPAEGYFATLAQVSPYAPALLAQFKELGGVPLRGTSRTICFLDRISSDEEVTAVRAGDIPPAEFEPPTGLAKVPLKGFEKAPPRKIERPKGYDNREDELDKEQNPLRQGDKK